MWSITAAPLARAQALNERRSDARTESDLALIAAAFGARLVFESHRHQLAHPKNVVNKIVAQDGPGIGNEFSHFRVTAT